MRFASKVIYFPTIRVPQNQWFLRMLLYWDEVGTITPTDYIENPELLDPYTRALIKEGLITQVIPAIYTYELPEFAPAFLSYLHADLAQLEARRASFRGSTPRLRIHLEKLYPISEPLKRLHLADHAFGPWYDVEAHTARDFMCYLAACLGRLEEVDSMPITDDVTHLRSFSGSTSPEAIEPLDAMRLIVLKSLFPAPIEPVEASALARFKERHIEELRRFRRRVEKELTEVADMSDPALQRRRLELFLDEAREEVEAIRSAMASNGWIRTGVATLSAVLATIPGVSPLIGLPGAVNAALSNKRQALARSPFLYAAEAEKAVG